MLSCVNPLCFASKQIAFGTSWSQRKKKASLYSGGHIIYLTEIQLPTIYFQLQTWKKPGNRNTPLRLLSRTGPF